MSRDDSPVDRALEIARADLEIEVPPGHAARVARAALAAAPVARPWWELALPVAWRAALAANLAGAALLAWALLREPPPAPAQSPVDQILDAEAAGMLSRALGLGEEAP